jgi:hypothetical protein
MKRTLWALALATLFLTAPALTAGAQSPLQIQPDQGVGVLSEAPASGERSSGSVFPFGNYTGTVSGEPVYCRTYLHFALDGLPAGATVQAATLHVYADDFWPDDKGAPMSVYPVAVDWTGSDWNDPAAWPALGGAAATTQVSASAGWFTWDVTTMVQGWLGGTANHGLAIAAADPASAADDWAAARRISAGDPTTLPYLEITYTAPPATDTPTPTPKPRPTAEPRPTAPPAEPEPTPTPLPAILLPESGAGSRAGALWLLAAGGLALLAGLARRRRPA